MTIAVGFGCLVAVALLKGVTGLPEPQVEDYTPAYHHAITPLTYQTDYFAPSYAAPRPVTYQTDYAVPTYDIPLPQTYPTNYGVPLQTTVIKVYQSPLHTTAVPVNEIQEDEYDYDSLNTLSLFKDVGCTTIKGLAKTVAKCALSSVLGCKVRHKTVKECWDTIVKCVDEDCFHQEKQVDSITVDGLAECESPDEKQWCTCGDPFSGCWDGSCVILPEPCLYGVLPNCNCGIGFRCCRNKSPPTSLEGIEENIDCSKPCPQIVSPVCGGTADDRMLQTYLNMCYLEIAICQDPAIEFKHNGPCNSEIKLVTPHNEIDLTTPAFGICGIGEGECGTGNCTNTFAVGIILRNCLCPPNPNPSEETYCWVA